MKTILSQNKAIEKDLRRGLKIHPRLAYKKHHCLRLAARIRDLKDAGLNIDDKMVYEEDVKFKMYWLKK